MGKPLRVLIIEDSEDDAQLLLWELKRGGYEPFFERVENAEAMRVALARGNWDIVVSDYVLPGFSGLDALEVAKQNARGLPFVIVSGKIGEDTAVRAMKAGAGDYLLKDNLSRLVPAIARELQEAEDRKKRWEAEAALVVSEQRYRRLVAAVTDYIYTVEVSDGRVIKTSHGQGSFAVTGYAAEEFEADPFLWYQMVLEEDRPAVMDMTHRLMAGEEVSSLEHRIIHKNGSIRWVRNTVVPRFTRQGELVAYDGLITDITERKRFEESLRLQSAALNAAANAIVITNREGYVSWVNPAFTELTGYTLEEVEGRTLELLKSGRHDSKFYRRLWETILDGAVWRGEIINKQKNGFLYTEEQTITPVRDDQGKISHFIAIKQDITERKLTERALLNNARMVRDMELARQIQLSLLPSAPPELAGSQLAACFVPAAHVGGDYYDFICRDERVLDVVIGDVSGHGVGQALIMAETRGVLRSLVRGVRGTAQVLTSLNDLLHEDLTRAEMFISMFYLSFNSESRTITFANAGHNPPLLFSMGSCSYRELDADGLILGVKQGENFEEVQVTLQLGDMLLLYTDGIIEARNPEGELFSTDRLAQILVRHHEESPKAVMDNVLRELEEFVGSSALQDDVTMVIIKLV